MASTESLKGQTLFDLTGKVALVTGGGSGIGLMAAQALAANGAKVYICGRTKEKLDTAASTHGKNAPGEIIPIQADINSKEGIKSLVDEIKSREKCICILVNNAGISGETFTTAEADSAEDLKKSLFESEKATFDDWLNVYRTNVAAVYFTTTALLPLLQTSTETHSGWSSTVINISSISGLVKTSQHHFSYNVSKGATEHLTRMMAADFAAAGLKIRVNSIAPGIFPSEMTTEGSDEGQKSQLDKSKYEGKIPANRPGKDEDMAQAVMFLASNQFVNGQRVVVDGGHTLAAGL
ncbi:enoyl-(Acyl carrier protein) reductase domain-containing protein [Trichoderma breve]|uniref:Enoyl-(Acyl carrier protein) reductase domain-containing protein n=1 Tax=Trichoderma breve TaxID=2034170 RepID=A0A9W9JQ10_9HYPO|nr:enoyl-(Acyl carrier protein) reductase domain-containing protein [Trichoderma breve]KAJ4863728.1 enoyl-(Acyl carrier protein) reductase domain-containing protein [Trichoderma breve]